MIYLLHYETKLGRSYHYIGWCLDGNLERRTRQHASGQGARTTAAFARLAIPFVVARTWDGEEADRRMERRLKNRKNAPRQLCPICRAAKSREAG